VNGFVLKILLFPGNVYCCKLFRVSRLGFLMSACLSNYHDALQLSYLTGFYMYSFTLHGFSVREGTAFHLLHLLPEVLCSIFSLLSSLLFLLCIYFFPFHSPKPRIWITPSLCTDLFKFIPPSYCLFFLF